MVAVSLDSVTRHARRRLAQRNLSLDDADYVIAHGSVTFSGHARFVHLGLRDIPATDRRDDRIRRLEGTILVFDSESGGCLTTAYRNRERGLKDIRRKPKRAFPERIDDDPTPFPASPGPGSPGRHDSPGSRPEAADEEPIH